MDGYYLLVWAIAIPSLYFLWRLACRWDEERMAEIKAEAASYEVAP